MLDADLTAIYGVTTAALNQAVKRNEVRFPADFCFQLSDGDIDTLISQNVISKPTRGGRTKPPRVFTESGALQAANVLRSKRAVAMSLFVIRAFIKMREQLATDAAILKRLAEIDKMLLVHDSALHDLYQKLLPLLFRSIPTAAAQNRFSPIVSGAEYLAAIALQTARAKDKARLLQFIEAPHALDRTKFEELVERHGLTDK